MGDDWAITTEGLGAAHKLEHLAHDPEQAVQLKA